MKATSLGACVEQLTLHVFARPRTPCKRSMMFQRLASVARFLAQGLIRRCLLMQGPGRHGGSQRRPRPCLPPSLPMEALMSPPRPSWLLQQLRHAPLLRPCDYLLADTLPLRPPAFNQITMFLGIAVLIVDGLPNCIC